MSLDEERRKEKEQEFLRRREEKMQRDLERRRKVTEAANAESQKRQIKQVQAQEQKKQELCEEQRKGPLEGVVAALHLWPVLTTALLRRAGQSRGQSQRHLRRTNSLA